MLEIDPDRFSVTLEYVEGMSERAASVAELTLICAVLAELMPELNSGNEE